MAKPDRILQFSKLLQTETVLLSTAGTDIPLGERKIIVISVEGKCFIKFSRDGTNAAATDFLLPVAGSYTFDTGSWTVLSIFASSAGNIVTSVAEMAN